MVSSESSPELSGGPSFGVVSSIPDREVVAIKMAQWEV